MRKKDQINLESKIKTVRFIGETFVMCNSLQRNLVCVKCRRMSTEKCSVFQQAFFFCKTNYSRTFYISLPEIDSSIVSACTAASFINWCLLSLLWQVNWQSSICFLKVKHYTVWRWVETFRPFWTAWEAKTRCGDTSKEHEYSWLIIFTDSFYTLGR